MICYFTKSLFFTHTICSYNKLIKNKQRKIKLDCSITVKIGTIYRNISMYKMLQFTIVMRSVGTY